MNDGLKHELLQMARRIISKAEMEVEFIDDVEIGSSGGTTYIRVTYSEPEPYIPTLPVTNVRINPTWDPAIKTWSDHLDNAQKDGYNQ